MKTVMIATPLYDGKIEVRYVDSLVETVRESTKRGYDITPSWVSYDALIQRCRNDLLAIAMDGGVDYLFWIDGDISWTTDQFYSIIESGYDVCGGTYPKKTDVEEYVFNLTKTIPKKVNNKHMKCDGLGTGFLMMTKKAYTALWDNSEAYVDKRNDARGGIKKMAFDVRVIDGDLHSEDIIACRTLTDAGFDIMLDTTVTCGHVGGGKLYTGDFNKWFFKSLKI